MPRDGSGGLRRRSAFRWAGSRSWWGSRRSFRRIGRRKVLTERGEIFLGHARRLLSVERAVIDMVMATHSPRLVRLGVPDDYYALLPRIFENFAAAQPGVEVELQCRPTADLDGMIAEGAIDLAIVTRGTGHGRLESLRHEPLVWVSSDGKIPNRQDVLPLATFQQGCTTRQYSIEALARAGRAFAVVFSSPSLTGVLQPVRSGIAITAIPRCSLPPGLAIITDEHELPALPSLELALMHNFNHSSLSSAPDAEILAEVIRSALAAN